MARSKKTKKQTGLRGLSPPRCPSNTENSTFSQAVQPKAASLNPDQLNRLVGRYHSTPDVVLSVTVENGHLFIQENDEPRQEFLAESGLDFYSTTSTDEYTFKPASGAAKVIVLHLGDKDLEFKRLE